MAAIVVLVYHSGFTALPFAKGYLAVDFFFCLSGYVIGSAYEHKLADGSLTLIAYMGVRLRRLWPMLFLGAVLGWCTIGLAKPDGYFIPFGAYSLPLAFVCQILFIPFVVSRGAFLFNGPQWSILFEIIANFFHGLFIRQLNDIVLASVITVSALFLVIIAKTFEYIDFGWGADNFVLGLPRVGFSFFTGLLLYRTRAKWRPRTPDLGFPWLALVLLLALGMPDVWEIGFNGVKREIGVDLLMLPLLVALGSKSSSNGRAIRWLGVLSYPLYAVHGAFLLMVIWLQAKVGAGQAFLAFGDVLITIIALAIGLFIDEPLNRLRKRSKRAVVVEAA